jgi:ABC-2 type transport system permease protein
MMGFAPLLLKELREQIRTYRLLAVAAVFVLFGILSPVTDRYMKELFDAIGTETGGFSMTVPAPSLKGVADQLLKNLSQFGIICALLLAMGSVAWEKERGTAAMIMTKPASRAAFLAAKLVAISLSLGLGVILGCGLAYLYTAILYPSNFPLGGFVAASAMLWWIAVVFAAITLLGSALTRSAIAAAGIGLVALIVLGIASALPVVGPYMPPSLGEPAMDLLLGRDPGAILGPLVFNVALVPVLFLVTWLSFRRQEL